MAETHERQLERGLAAMRRLRLHPDLAEHRADEALRACRTRANRPRARAGWWLALPATAFVIVVAALAMRVSTSTSPAQPFPAQIGERVMLVASPGTRYAVTGASADETTVFVEAGAVTARLHGGLDPHQLHLVSRDVRATAAGTTFSLVVRDGEPSTVIVHDGLVDVRQGDTVRRVAPGSSAADAGPHAAALRRAVEALRAQPLLSRAAVPSQQQQRSESEAAAAEALDAGPADAHRHSSSDGRRTDSTSTPRAGEPDGVPSNAARWRRARLLRARGDLRGALSILDELVAGDDEVWAPLALVESIRVHSALVQPARVVELSDVFSRRFRSHTLAAEVEILRCRARQRLGTIPPTTDCGMAAEDAAAGGLVRE